MDIQVDSQGYTIYRGRILHYHRQQNDKDALMKGLNKQDKMSTQRIQLNSVHNGQNLIVLKILKQNK